MVMVKNTQPDHGETDSTQYQYQHQPMIRDLPNGEQPRERLREYGSRYLSNTELIAILLRTGVKGQNVLSLSSSLLARRDGLAGLGRSTFAELCTERGLSEAKACQLLAALELGRRFASLVPEERATISSPQDVANLLAAEMTTLDQEHLRVLLLDSGNQVLSIQEIYVGNVSGAAVRVSEVFRPAVRDNVPAIIVVHNHPSGDPSPSADDVSVTRDLVSAGKLMDIELLDHVILGAGNSYVSLKEKGMGFS